MTRLSLIISLLLAVALSYIGYLTHLNIEETRRNKEALQELALRVAQSQRTVEVSATTPAPLPAPAVVVQAVGEPCRCEKEKPETLRMPEEKKESKVLDSPNIYRVARGENLWRISIKLYKTPWKWHLLWKANEARIPNYRKMPAGFVLKLPA